MFANCAKGVWMLIDTDVLIWFLRGRNSALDAIRRCPSVELSAVSYMELVQGVHDKNELRTLLRTIRINGWRILPLTESISHRATWYIESYALSDGMRVGGRPDRRLGRAVGRGPHDRKRPTQQVHP